MSYHFTPTGALTDASQTASIAEIKTKTDKIIIDLSSSDLNLNTMNNDLTAAAVINNTQNAQLAMTTGSNMKTAIDLNSAKIGITTQQASDIVVNNATVGITPSQSSIITQNSNKLNMTVASAMKTAVDGNSSSITTLNAAYPRNTILAWIGSQTGNIFYDGNITLNWDGTNKQLRFLIQNIASNQYMTGGVKITKPTSQGIQISNYLSYGVSTAYKYFTGSQVPANSSYLNTTYNLASYTRAVYWLQPFSLSTFPTYEITVFVGSSGSSMKIHIKKYNN